jgi:hypothetical protein
MAIALMGFTLHSELDRRCELVERNSNAGEARDLWCEASQLKSPQATVARFASVPSPPRRALVASPQGEAD